MYIYNDDIITYYTDYFYSICYKNLNSLMGEKKYFEGGPIMFERLDGKEKKIIIDTHTDNYGLFFQWEILSLKIFFRVG